MSYEASCDYFRKKYQMWSSAHPHYDVKKYINSKGKTGLIQEFRNDSLFSKVICPYLAQYAKGKEKDEMKSIFNDTLALLQGDAMPVEMDLVVGAVLEACGYTKKGSGLIWIVVAALILVGIAGAAFSSTKSKRR